MQETTPVLTASARIELLEQLLALTTRDLTPDEILAEAGAHLAAALGDVVVTYVELTEDGTLRPRSTTSPSGLPPALPVFPEVLTALEEGPLVIDDVLDEEWLEPVWPLLAERAVRAAVDVPLHREGRVEGIFWFNASEPRRWSDDEVRILVGVTQQLGLVLERADAAERRRRTERDLERRDAILLAASRAARLLLEARSWTDVAEEVLALLGKAAGASRAYVFENLPNGTPLPECVQRAEWSLRRWQSPEAHPALGRFQPAPHFPRWADVLGAGETINARTRDLPDGERELIELLEARSTLAVPIFVGGEWWGFVGFDDCVEERVWTPTEEEVLRVAASILGGAIAHQRRDAITRAVFETAHDAIFITNRSGDYVDVNPAGCALLGVPHEELVGMNVKDFLPDEDVRRFEPYWERFNTAPPGIELWHSRRADGAVLDVEASFRPDFVPGLNIAFLRDVTERRRLEHELVGAQRLESLGRLAGGVAHDFNNLLTAIGGYTSLLLERARGDELLVHDLRQIEAATQRAAELTRQLLAFGRRQLLQPEAVDLNEVLQTVAPLLERVVGDDVELELALSAEPATVVADPGQLEQVVVNLAMNAHDAMPDGGRLVVSTTVTDDGVALAVADTGVGMDAATRERVFDPFFSTRAEGVGLGLASVHGIVSQSNGTVVVESEPGAGSTFTVRLPRAPEAIRAAAPAASDDAADAARRTILLVEDEDVVRSLAQRVLERAGYHVLTCAEGQSALAVAESHDGPIDLLLTDVVMPGLRGPEVAARVAERRPDIRVLYMSGYADEALLGSAAIAGDALIEKPFAVDELAARVGAALAADG